MRILAFAYAREPDKGSYTLLGRPSREDILVGVGGLGWVRDAVSAYTSTAGLPFSLVPVALASYLRGTAGSEPTGDPTPESRSRTELLRALA